MDSTATLFIARCSLFIEREMLRFAQHDKPSKHVGSDPSFIARCSLFIEREMLRFAQHDTPIEHLGTGPLFIAHCSLFIVRCSLFIATSAFFISAPSFSQQILFTEDFEDANFTSRGWYDNNKLYVTTAEHIPGSRSAIEFRFLKGATTPTTGGGVRRKFAPTESVYLSYWVKYSANWEGSNRPYHPHEFHFLTDADWDYIGPAATHLTTYIEQNEGTPLLGIQDVLNIDETKIGQNLLGVTENRAVSGCNGSSDRYPPGDCYASGSGHANGKIWKANRVYFTDSSGAFYKNDWHFIEAWFKLNSIVAGKGIADGVVRYWYDGAFVIDAPDVMLRTGKNATMKFNQFMIAPYIGDGSPVEQVMWVDNLTVATGRPERTGIGRVLPDRRAVVEVYPNPFTDRATIQLRMTNDELRMGEQSAIRNPKSPISLKVYDVLGREVLDLTDRARVQEIITLEGAMLPHPGVYYIRLKSPTHSQTGKMVLVR